MSHNHIGDSSTLVQVMAWCHQKNGTDVKKPTKKYLCTKFEGLILIFEAMNAKN